MNESLSLSHLHYFSKNNYFYGNKIKEYKIFFQSFFAILNSIVPNEYLHNIYTLVNFEISVG